MIHALFLASFKGIESNKHLFVSTISYGVWILKNSYPDDEGYLMGNESFYGVWIIENLYSEDEGYFKRNVKVSLTTYVKILHKIIL